jgi:hypothetical protein
MSFDGFLTLRCAQPAVEQVQTGFFFFLAVV